MDHMENTQKIKSRTIRKTAKNEDAKAYAETIKREFRQMLEIQQEIDRRIKRDAYGLSREQAARLTKSEAMQIIEAAAKHCADYMELDKGSGNATASELEAGRKAAEDMAEKAKQWAELTAEEDTGK